MNGWGSLQEYDPNFFRVDESWTNMKINKRKKHRWCFVKIMIKDRAFKGDPPENIEEVPYRPLTSYFNHAWKGLYRRAAQVVDYLISYEPSVTTTTKNFTHCINKHNEQYLQDISRIMEENNLEFVEAMKRVPPIRIRTHDVKDFFTACNTDLALEFIQSRMSHYKAQGFNYFKIEDEKSFLKRLQVHDTTRKQIIRWSTVVDFGIEKPRRGITLQKSKPARGTWISFKGLIAILKHDLGHVFIRSSGGIYRQTSGGPMGSPTMCAVANSFGCSEERRWRLNNRSTVLPRLHKRYVDDSFSITYLRPNILDIFPDYSGCKLKETSEDKEFLGLEIGLLHERFITLRPKPQQQWKVIPEGTTITPQQKKGLDRGRLVRIKLNSTHLQPEL
ncbi:unnamed protein product [Amoebophrya sp. A25]|nr:unnamed protein product [Amoebophrya sp. A25]|eukprot:GSA25T00008664001.1